MKKIAAAAIAGAFVVAIPAGAIGAEAGSTAPVTSDFVTIGGPKRLHPDNHLRIPIRCSVACYTTVYTTLILPDRQIGPDKATGRLVADQTRKLVVSFNDAATQDLKDHFNSSRLKVAVRGRDLTSNEETRAVKRFRFTRP